MTSYLWAYSTTLRVSSMFFSNGWCEASIMTEEKPVSMQDLHSSNVSPWSRCRAKLSFEPVLRIIASAPCAR